jgi:hypothetical protein
LSIGTGTLLRACIVGLEREGVSTMVRKAIIIIALSVVAPFILSNNTHAELTATGDALPLRKGENVLAAGVWNWPTEGGFAGLHVGVRVTVNGESLVDETTDMRYIVPTRDIPNALNPTGWTGIDFDDSDWHKGKYLIGYGTNRSINTPAGSLEQRTRSVYSRARFKISDPASIGNFTLSASCDDGGVIWLNGVEIARSSNFSPTTSHWDSESPLPGLLTATSLRTQINQTIMYTCIRWLRGFYVEIWLSTRLCFVHEKLRN